MKQYLKDIAHEYIEEVIENSYDAFPELLRAWAFPGDGFGCYSSFELRLEFHEIKPTLREFKLLRGRAFDPNDYEEGWGWSDSEILKGMSWWKHPNGIEVGWYWDGDGTLAFYVPEMNKVFRNTDCKCSYGWEEEHVNP